MLLPEGFDRDNGKMYEEVNIPSSTDAPTGVGKKLINIAELDEVGGGGLGQHLHFVFGMSSLLTS